jgi:hypothetical protein
MKRSVISPACWQPVKDRFLEKILRRCGAYYHSGDLFYQELLKQRLSHLGFRVLSIEKLPYHHVWDIRLCGTLSAQTYLLVTKPVPKKDAWADDLMLRQLRSEMHEIVRDLGPPVKRDCLGVVRTGAYFRVSFIWPVGKPGQLLRKEKKAEAFSFLIRPWVRRNRN